MKTYKSMRTVFMALAALLVMALAPMAASAQDTVFFILDASGSMWGQIDGQAKMTTAKEAMAGVVNDLPDDLQVGLMAYGHRRKGDCGDVETVVPIGPLNKKQILDAVANISPKGKTPLTASVLQAAQSIKKSQGRVTIILVSDGKESCDGDPCQMVAELKKKGIDFVLHVIGFDVKGQERQQLECMAKAGGGMYLPASDAGQLKLAASQAVASSALKKLPKLIVQGLINGKPASVRVDIAKDGKEFFSVSTTETEPVKIPLAPGQYQLTVFEPLTEQSQSEDLIMAEADQKKQFDFGVGRIQLGVTINGKPGEAGYDIVAQGGEKVIKGGYVNLGEKEIVALVPGVYDVKFALPNTAGSKVVVVRDVNAAAGTTAQAAAEFGQGKLQLSVTINGKPGEAGYDVFVAGSDDIITSGYVSLGENEVIGLPPGVYDIKFSQPNTAGSAPAVVKDVQVGPSALAKASADFGQGKLRFVVTVNGKPGEADYDVFPAGSEDALTSGFVNAGEDEVIELPPGVYDIKFRQPNTPGSKPVLVRDIKVASGTPAKASAEFGQGKLRLSVTVNGKPGEADYSVIPAGTENALTSGYISMGENETIELPPGEYSVKFTMNNTLGAKPMTISGIKVSVGSVAKAQGAFARGQLIITVSVNGKPGEADYDVFNSDEEGSIGSGYVSADETEKVLVVPGSYDLVFTPQGGPDMQPLTMKDIKVTAGAKVKLVADFKK